MCEHICYYILFIVMNGVDPNSKVIWNVFEKGLKMALKRKKRKLENKSIFKVVKFILESLTKLSIFIK